MLTSWRYHSSADSPAGTMRLELFKPLAGEGVYRAAAASDVEDLEPSKAYEFRARIPVERGYMLGLDPGADAEVAMTVTSGADQMYQFGGDVPVGATNTATGPFPTYRVNVAATVEPDADHDYYGDRTQDRCPTQSATHRACSNRFRLGEPRLKRGKGSATVRVRVPGPGTISLKGKGVARRHRSFPAGARVVTGPGSVKLAIKAKGKARKKLDLTGRATVRIRVTYRPTGGRPRTKRAKVELVKR